jgi:hypothetical protein
MATIAKIAPPNRDAYGSDYLKYLSHYKAYRSYVFSLKTSSKNSKISSKAPADSASQRTAEASKPLVGKPARKPTKPKKKQAALRQLTNLELLERKANTISNIVTLNKNIAESDGWTTVKPRSSKKKATASTQKVVQKATSGDVAPQKPGKAKFQIVQNPEYKFWFTEKARLTEAKSKANNYDNNAALASFEKLRPKAPPQFYKVDLVSGTSVPYSLAAS